MLSPSDWVRAVCIISSRIIQDKDNVWSSQHFRDWPGGWAGLGAGLSGLGNSLEAEVCGLS